MESMYLHGAEDVAQAGRNVAGGAEVIRSAVSNLEDITSRHQRFMDDWLDRLESILEADRTARERDAPEDKCEREVKT